MKIKPETYYCMWLNTQRAGVGVKGQTSERSGNGKQFSECFQKPWLLIFNFLLECYFRGASHFVKAEHAVIRTLF
jgi:hypothetical protein